MAKPHLLKTSVQWRHLLPGLWAGALIAVAALAAPSAFAVLARPDAGRLVARLFLQEAWASVALGAVLLTATFIRTDQRTTRAVAGERILPCIALLATVLGYFAIQPLLPAARQGSGLFNFAQLHVFSTAMYALKTVAVLLLAWRVASASEIVSPKPSS